MDSLSFIQSKNNRVSLYNYLEQKFEEFRSRAIQMMKIDDE